MGIIAKVTPRPIRGAIVESVEAAVPEQHRHHIPDALTYTGTALIVGGVAIRHRLPRVSACMRIWGKFHDDLDGSAALRWGLMDRAGQIKDALNDKVVIGAEIYAFSKDIKRLPQEQRPLRRVIVGAIATKHTLNASLNSGIEHFGGDASAHITGKANMWLDGLTTGFLGASDVMDQEAHPKLHTFSTAVGYTAAALGAAAGLASAGVYSRRLLHAYRHRNDEPAQQLDVLSNPEPPEMAISIVADDSVVDSEYASRDSTT